MTYYVGINTHVFTSLSWSLVACICDLDSIRTRYDYNTEIPGSIPGCTLVIVKINKNLCIIVNADGSVRTG